MKLLTVLLLSLGLAGAASAKSSKVPDISHADLQKAVAAKAVTLLDANGTESFKEGRIPGAIDYASAKAKLAAMLPKDKGALIVAYCGGPRCKAYKAAAEAAEKLGYKNVKHMSAGISGWTAAGEKTEKAKH